MNQAGTCKLLFSRLPPFCRAPVKISPLAVPAIPESGSGSPAQTEHMLYSGDVSFIRRSWLKWMQLSHSSQVEGGWRHKLRESGLVTNSQRTRR